MKEDIFSAKILDKVQIRLADSRDLSNVIQLDARITSLSKSQYWEEMFNQFVGRGNRYFMIAEDKSGSEVEIPFVGFIVGEIRAWEFGSQPCGWVLTILVNPEYQGRGVGEKLFDTICKQMKVDGVVTVRTMVAREDKLNMSFFRAQGMMAGPFIELEKLLD